jgi:hypothetical protein
MDELRRDIRDVFERQQAALGSLAHARERVMRQALARRERAGGQLLRLAAGAVAVLLAASIVSALLLVRAADRAHPAIPVVTPVVTPTPSPLPKRLTQPLAVPAGQPVVLYRDPADVTQVDGVTWDGRTSGRVGPATKNANLSLDPTGTLYEADNQTVRDRTGSVVGQFEQAQVSRYWADDGHHYCWIDPVVPLPSTIGVAAILQLRAPGEKARVVAQVGTIARQSGIQVVACSVRRDRAVVVQGYAQAAIAARVWVVELSTGRIVWARTYPSDGVSQVHVEASQDGRYVAEVRASCCPMGTPPPASTTVSTTVEDTVGGAVGHVPGNVVALSWDGSLALVQAPANGASPPHVIRWRDGVVVWQAAAGWTYASSIAEPGGQRLAVVVGDPSGPSLARSDDVYVVAPAGQARLLLDHVPR